MILYLQEEGGASSAPQRMAKAEKDAVPGVAIKGITITPKKTPTGIEDVTRDAEGTSKLLHNGQILILRGDKIYTVTGQLAR